LAFAVLNGIAFKQAWSMTHFTVGSAKAVSLHGLSAWERVRILAGGIAVTRPVNAKNPLDYGMKFSTVRFPSGKEGVLEGWLIAGSGNKPPVIMFHGYAAGKGGLLESARYFHQLGYPVFMVDFRGSGGSFGNSTSIGYHEAGDVLNTVRYAAGIFAKGPPIIFGRSMGAAAILRAMRDLGLKPGMLILESPFDALLHTVANRFRMMGVPAFPGAELLTFWGSLQGGFNGFALKPAEYAKSVHVPVLVMCGDRDRRVSVGEVESVYGNLAGEKVLKVFRGAGHEGFEVEKAREWRKAVREFLKQ